MIPDKLVLVSLFRVFVTMWHRVVAPYNLLDNRFTGVLYSSGRARNILHRTAGQVKRIIRKRVWKKKSKYRRIFMQLFHILLMNA